MFVIPASFANDIGFVEGLTPSIKIYRVNTKTNMSVEEVDDTMTDIGNGNYQYSFSNYKVDNLYYYNIDAGTDDVSARFVRGNNNFDYYGNKNIRGRQARGGGGSAISPIILEQAVAKGIAKEMEKLDIPVATEAERVDLSPVMAGLELLNKKELDISDIQLDMINNTDVITKSIEDKVSSVIDTINEGVSMLDKKLEEMKGIESNITKTVERINNMTSKDAIIGDQSFKDLVEITKLLEFLNNNK